MSTEHWDISFLQSIRDSLTHPLGANVTTWFNFNGSFEAGIQNFDGSFK